MDCDNDHSDNPDEWITPEFLADNLTDVAFAVTYSRHHMLPKGNKSARPRFHVFFPTAPCNDALSHKAIKAKIYKELPFFDGNALDASRFLFGCPSDVFWHEGSLSIENWLTLMKSNRNIPQGQRNSTMSRIAGKLVKRFGVTDTAYQKFLEKASECESPLPDDELETIWHSACKFGKKVVVHIILFIVKIIPEFLTACNGRISGNTKTFKFHKCNFNLLFSFCKLYICVFYHSKCYSVF